MIPPNGKIINSNLPGGWAQAQHPPRAGDGSSTVSSKGRMRAIAGKAINREPDTATSSSRWLFIRDYRGAAQAGLIGKLNPLIRGWANYYKTCSAKVTFNKMSAQLYHKLRRWAALRQPRKWPKWCYRRYWQRLDGLICFTDGQHYLYQYEQTKIRRHVKVIGPKSPFDGDWLYWAQRLQRHPLKPLRVVKLLKWQGGKCEDCGLPFTTEDVLEVHHLNGNHSDNRYVNLSLLHGHCHDIAHAVRC